MNGEREISLDTETTGFEPSQGDRIVEIGAVEMINRVRTGKSYHVYLNPERAMPQKAFEIHGLSEEFLSDKALFKDVAQDFLDFIGNDRLVIHNAKFDLKFLNAELEWAGREPLTNPVTDTLRLAQDTLPNKQANLDNLCKHFGIDNSGRTLHGALLDADLLAQVYMQLLGGPNYSLDLPEEGADQAAEAAALVKKEIEAAALDYSLVLKPTETELRDNRLFREEHDLTAS
jgi:DNA polymerase III subunit epsilon